jgi:hypothetical protein
VGRRRHGIPAAIATVFAGLVLASCTSAAGSGPSTGIGTSVGSPTPDTTTTAPGIRACGDGPPCYADPVKTGVIPGEAPEASGLAASSTDPDLFFTVDDASRTNAIVAIHRTGTVAAKIGIMGMSAKNAEALVNGVCAAGSRDQCLYVGDIGDNSATRATITVYRTAQPDPARLTPGPSSAPSSSAPLSLVQPAVRWDYTYPDGPHNAEAMLIADDGSVVIVTKPPGGTTPTRVYRGAAGGGRLGLAGTFTPPAGTGRSLSALVSGNVVTDASRLTDRVLLITYDQALEFRAPAPGADPATFPDWPVRRLPIPRQDQSEGVSYAAAGGLDACGYLVVSEKGLGDQAAIGAVGCR